MAEEVRGDLEAAERAVEQRLRRAGEEAPDEPGFWDQAFRFGKDFVGGAVEATVGLGDFVFKLTLIYALVHPEGYVESLVGLDQGVAYGVTHPVEFAQAVTNWDLWLDNPARALGQLVPDLVLAVGTAGSGVAATAAARAAGSSTTWPAPPGPVTGWRGRERARCSRRRRHSCVRPVDKYLRCLQR